MTHLLIALLLIQSEAALPDRLNLACNGGGYANQFDQSTAQAWNNQGDSATVTMQSRRAQGFEDEVQLWIEGDEGRIRMPRSMLPLLRGGDNGWFRVTSVEVTENEIRGTVRVNLINNPKLRLDRLTGSISISGKAGDYSGRCIKFDPDEVERAF